MSYRIVSDGWQRDETAGRVRFTHVLIDGRRLVRMRWMPFSADSMGPVMDAIEYEDVDEDASIGLIKRVVCHALDLHAAQRAVLAAFDAGVPEECRFLRVHTEGE